MATPLERRVGRRVNITEEKRTFENEKSIQRAFGIPPRFNESLLVSTKDGKQLLIPAKSSNITQRGRKQAHNIKNHNLKVKSSKHIEADNTSENSSASLDEDTYSTFENDNNFNDKIQAKDIETSAEFDSIFRSVNNDLERLSKQMHESLISDIKPKINLTSTEFTSSRSKSEHLNPILDSSQGFVSTSNLFSSKESFNDIKIDNNIRKGIDSKNELLIQKVSKIKDDFKGENLSKLGQNDNVNTLINKLSSSISRMKNIVLGKDKFTRIMRDQIQKSNIEIIKLSQKIDLLQKEISAAKRGKEKYKDSIKKLLLEMQRGKVDGTTHSYLLEISALKVQNERTLNKLNESEIKLIQIQTENSRLKEENDDLGKKIIQLEEKINKLNLIVNQVTNEKLQLLESRDRSNKEIDLLLENIKSCNDENKMSLEELRRGYELNNVLQDHIIFLKTQLEIAGDERVSQEQITKALKEECNYFKQSLKSLEHRESVLLSALEDSSYKMSDIDKALEEQKIKYEIMLKKENDKYVDIFHSYKKQSEELATLKQQLKEKTEDEQEQLKINNELKYKFSSFETHIRRLLDARDNEIMQLNDYMDGKLKMKDEENKKRIQEICKMQQEREKRLINQMLDQHDGFERKRIEYENEMDILRNNMTEKLEMTVKLENEKQLRLAETLINKEHELMLKENTIQEIDKKKKQIEDQLSETKLFIDNLLSEKNETVEKLLSLDKWGAIIQTMNLMNPDTQKIISERLSDIREEVEKIEINDEGKNTTNSICKV
ncbi:hypothetical protein FG386_000449 [Cryptosporidium ryanae]|uniref:uncharacterized protein n=1 Tax=Cryptosporidium ryanae TaxID=515981 RepID=UPI00351A35C1|nr:hypothetical protein FG386_000449 [Cryptosporidium ryanae]